MQQIARELNGIELANLVLSKGASLTGDPEELHVDLRLAHTNLRDHVHKTMVKAIAEKYQVANELKRRTGKSLNEIYPDHNADRNARDHAVAEIYKLKPQIHARIRLTQNALPNIVNHWKVDDFKNCFGNDGVQAVFLLTGRISDVQFKKMRALDDSVIGRRYVLSVHDCPMEFIIDVNQLDALPVEVIDRYVPTILQWISKKPE